MDASEKRRIFMEMKALKQNRLNEEVREDYTSSVDTQSGSIQTVQFGDGNKYVAVSYKLYTKNSEGEVELFEETPAGHPFQFISGMGFTLDKFESEILAKQKGEDFDFTIASEEAYGEFMEEAVVELDKKIFEIDGKFDSEYVRPGQVIPLQNAEGQRMNGTVSEVKADKVVVDLNHPLAGFDLNFKGNISELRDASNEEIASFVNAMSGGCK